MPPKKVTPESVTCNETLFEWTLDTTGTNEEMEQKIDDLRLQVLGGVHHAMDAIDEHIGLAEDSTNKRARRISLKLVMEVKALLAPSSTSGKNPADKRKGKKK